MPKCLVTGTARDVERWTLRGTRRPHCREKLAQYKVPRELFVIDELPRNPTAGGVVLAAGENYAGAGRTNAPVHPLRGSTPSVVQ